MTRAAVIGFGSIGRRHARLLAALGCEVAVVSRRAIDHQPAFESIHAVRRAFAPEYVVVANDTAQHAAALIELVATGYSGRLLVEKPLAAAAPSGARFDCAAVGYNLRFHPVLVALQAALRTERLISLQAYCGQYLPDWRPGTDYRQSYSADARRGGGVLRDLSHELDYLLWLGGGWKRVAALGGRTGELEISSDDSWALLLELDRCAVVSLQINYLDRPGRRAIVANTAKHTYVADLAAFTLTRDGEQQAFAKDPEAMYLEQHKAMLAGDATRLCSLEQGEEVMRLIAAVERAAAERCWVSR